MSSIIDRALRAGLLGVTLLLIPACAFTAHSSGHHLRESVSRADAAYQELPAGLPAYNSALLGICRTLSIQGIEKGKENLQEIGVTLVLPDALSAIEEIRPAPLPSGPDGNTAGSPVVIKYRSPPLSFHPPEGLFVDGTATYEKDGKTSKIVIRTKSDRVQIGDENYAATLNSSAAAEHLNSLSKRLGRSGFMSMIRPTAASRKPRVYLLDPFDPDKIPLLMVHGLQSTPLAFSELVKGLRREPAFRQKYQIWQFHYASGTPVLVNAASLRSSLNETVTALDPMGRSIARKGIVVIGHSMGGVISHTLVSSSGERIWSSIFKVPPSKLTGDAEAIGYLDRIFHFKRDLRISKVIFMAAPHRGSPVALSFVGLAGNMMTRLSTMEEHRFSRLAAENPNAMTAEAAEFYRGGRFSAVRTLSPRSPALRALSDLPIQVPFHSIIGQKQPGRVEEGSDGVVPYSSSHLEGAVSEKIVKSGHAIISNPEAIREVIRILLSE